MRPRSVGLIAAVVVVAGTTLLVYLLKGSAPAAALGVVYLLGVVLVASLWGARLGIATAVGSTLAFNFFHLPPTGGFAISEADNWVALGVFFVAALAASELAQRARRRAEEADRRRREADLSADMARRLLRSDDLDRSLADVGAALAAALDIPNAAIELDAVEPPADGLAFALRDGSRVLGTLLVPADLPEPTLRRLAEGIVPAMEALLAAAVERDELLGSRVEAAALRRSDVVKTALLRTVSHDLRSPLTAIRTAAEPLGAPGLPDDERHELSAVVREEAERLSRLIDNLLDLSRLEANAAEPRLGWCDIGEVISAAADDMRGDLQLQISPELPLIRADAAQLERAFANLLENSTRYSGGHPVVVRAWPLHNRILVRIIDRGPGIPPDQAERVFEPFHRNGGDGSGHRGAGLGLAIVRGFVEANRGKVWIESPPGGTCFVVEFPVEPSPAQESVA